MVFLDLILSKHTKKNATWSHRKWCLLRLLPLLNKENKSRRRRKKKQDGRLLGNSDLMEEEGEGKGLIQHELEVTAKVRR